jgi:carboxypeptidase C (cathepsin A)
VCNYLGNRAWTLKLDWDHTADFNAAQEKDWNGGGGAGEVIERPDVPAMAVWFDC